MIHACPSQWRDAGRRSARGCQGALSRELPSYFGPCRALERDAKGSASWPGGSRANIQVLELIAVLLFPGRGTASIYELSDARATGAELELSDARAHHRAELDAATLAAVLARSTGPSWAPR
jgi:hypothetical protein